MNKKLSAGIALLILILLSGSFYLQAPKEGMFRGRINLHAPVAQAGTVETVATSVTVGNDPPTLSDLSLNAGDGIILADNTTRGVSLSGQLVDNNGCDDITGGTISGAIYTDSLSLTCSSNDNSCYNSLTCDVDSCSSGTAAITCVADLWFHSNPELWKGSILVTDANSATTEGTSATVSVNELQTLLVTESIAYGSVSAGSTSPNQSAVVTATGNVAIDCSISGTDMTSVSATHTIDVQQQKYDLSDPGTWDGLSNTLLESDAALELGITEKPTTNPSNQTDTTYWGIKVPVGTPNANDYGGTNTFTSAPD